MHERAVQVEVLGLEWSAGAPEPFLISTEDRTLFAFHAPDDSGDELIRVAEFVGCTSVRFGFPNDEALGGHPLYGRGLVFYAVHEVLKSHWLDELRRIERSHPASASSPFPNARHWVLTFHDTTLEAIAVGIDLRGEYPDRASAALGMIGLAALD